MTIRYKSDNFTWDFWENSELDRLHLKSWEFNGECLNKVLDEEAEDTREHFEKNGWDLDRDCIRELILEKIFGLNILEIIDHKIAKKANVAINVKDNKYELKDGYKPIYMNDKTGEIILVENCKDKSYVFKYKESNGYTFIGRL